MKKININKRIKYNNLINIIIIITFIGMLTFIFNFKGGEFMHKKDDQPVEGGVVTNGKIEGYEEKIKSKELTKFEYDGYHFFVSCELKDDKLQVKSRGGNSKKRDGTYFILNYESKDNKLLEKLQTIIDKHNITKNNGYSYEVAGLPEGLGDKITAEYKTKEKIWKYSNQSPTISEETANEIYEAFHECAKENGFDFTSHASNVLLYDDATEEYVQGRWKGTHFGNEYELVFAGKNVKIYQDGQLTDDVEYAIIEGNIVVNRIKEGIDNPKDRYDYEEFSSISTISKKNNFTMVAYFTKESYSTCELLKQE